jgi:polyferredoxin
MRKPVGLDVLHDRNTLYRSLDSGEIENVYLLKIMNKGAEPRRFIVKVTDASGAASAVYRLDPTIPAFTVPAGEVFNAAVRVRKDAWDDTGETAARTDGVADLRFEVQAENDPSLRASAESRFFSPRE